jgi:glycine betaine catabolism A
MANSDIHTSLTGRFPELGTGPIDVGPYRDPEFYEREKEAIFRRSWMVAGRVSEIPEPGDFLVRDVPTFDISLIFVRGPDGKVRGFHNACRHRGNHVCLQKSGNCRGFTCKFHGWTYNLEGELVGVPDEKSFFDLDKSTRGLVPVPTDIWEGFIFFNLDPTPEQTLSQYLGGFGDALAGFPFEEGVSRFQFSGEIKANWKSVIDSFCEIYHVPFLHKLSISETLAGPDNPHGHLLDIRTYGPHRTATITGNKDYRPKPVQGIAYGFAQGAAITGGQGERAELPPGVNPTNSDNWGLDVNIMFPNLLPVIGPGMYFTHQMWPLAADRTIWEMTAYLAPAKSAADRFVQEYFMVELRDTVLEDMNTVERAQSAINAGVINEFVYQDHEVALRYHYNIINKCLDEFESRAAAE